MNSMSRDYCHDDYNHCKKEKDFCPTIVKCSCPSSTTIPVIATAGASFPLSSLTVDTSDMCNPCTKLQFTSNLVAPVAFTGTINFQVAKLCRCQSTPIPVGPVWTFNAAALVTSQPFNFFVCDCDSCFDDCCIYTVTATAATTTIGTLSVNNATLGAISTCEKNNHCNDHCNNHCNNHCNDHCNNHCR
ncbi:DUF4489 domain-containing protein [Clostridium sp. VAP41]|uniref:DUF4489 domain-containing protein n=1 Tax=Clostridium sp. VAP41 TaxID=2949979 RepID=UPI00207AA299|nr:DUF4489 domain-containing protein [Clostridium sp. VAP41]